MLQWTQYFDVKYLDFILILFSLISLILFIHIIIKAIKDRKNDNLEVENTDNLNKDLPENDSSNKNLKKQNRKLLFNIIDIVLYKIVPILFVLIVFIQTINLAFPSLFSSIFPPDSYQKITITNNKIYNQKVVLLGRLSYSNNWIPVLCFNHFLQFAPTMELASTEKIICNIRTGVKDIDHIIIANVDESNNIIYESNNKLNDTNNTIYYLNKHINEAFVFAVPSNDIYVSTAVMNRMATDINIYFVGLANIILMYFTGLIGCVALFFVIFFRTDNKKIIKIILLPLPFLILASALGIVAFLNINTFLYLI